MEKDSIHYRLPELEGIRVALEAAIGEYHSKKENANEKITISVGLIFSELRLITATKIFTEPEQQKVYLHRLQIGLSLLSEACEIILLPESSAAKKNNADLDVISKGINDTFDYLIGEFSPSFNFQLKAPLLFKVALALQCDKLWERLLADLRSAGTDDELVDILQAYHNEVFCGSNQSFGQLRYLSALLASIKEIDLDKEIAISQILLSRFCYLNFNYYPMEQYWIKKIQRDYDQVESYREEFIQLTIQLRSLSQCVVRGDCGYDPQVERFGEVLVNVLQNEISCVKKLLNMNLKAQGNNGAKLLLQAFYFRISISMEQFLFIFRLLIDKGIVIVKRKADLYEFIHSHVGTLKKDHLSIGNMQNTYGENNRMTAIRVRALLQSLIAHIDEKYL